MTPAFGGSSPHRCQLDTGSREAIVLANPQAELPPSPMITSIELENFKCFKSLKINDLALINIVVGGNSSGKTALLESIYLPGHDPGMPLQYTRWRSAPSPPVVTTKEGYELLWKGLFWRFSQNSPIAINLLGDEKSRAKLRIFYHDSAQSELQIPPEPGVEPVAPITPPIIPILFETVDAQDKTYQNQVVHDQSKKMLLRQGDLPTPPPIEFFYTGMILNAQNTAFQFSQLDESQKSKIRDAMKAIFPRIDNITVAGTSPATYAIVCSVPELDQEIPVGLVSTGVNKLLWLLINISKFAGGVILIDEIENGIYHKTFPKIWKAVLEFCEFYNTQIFATTHSGECLTSLMSIMAEKSHLFKLLRPKICEDRSHTMEAFNGSDFEAALETGVDVRG